METETKLPSEIIRKDKILRKSAEALCKLRWHWTMNEDNPRKMGFAEYADEVGTDWHNVKRDATAWTKFKQYKAEQKGVTRSKRKSKKIDEFRERERMSEERDLVIQALAQAYKKSYSTIAKNYRPEVQEVIDEVRWRMEKKGTSFEEQIEPVINARLEMQHREAQEKKQRKDHMREECWKMQGYLGYAVQRIRQACLIAEDLDFGEQEREILSHSLSSLRALVNLLERKVTGEERTDWDTELKKLMKQYQAKGDIAYDGGVEASEVN